ncbi:MAG: YraN family protein [Pelagibacterales bacterium]|nr:YraN family protein [Pelagibacterales bacterium]
MKKNTYQFGVMAEKISIFLLRIKGYKILFWRYKTYLGEIDIIAKKGNLIVVAEVKARKSHLLTEDVLKITQVKRIKNATEIFLSKNHQFRKCSIRFDFFLVGKFLLPKHYKNFY